MAAQIRDLRLKVKNLTTCKKYIIEFMISLLVQREALLYVPLF